MYRQNKNDTSPVTSLLNQAIGMNSNDAEALIYQEDLAVVNPGNPYVTIVVATILSFDIPQHASNVTVGRDDLQGAYVAQKEFNDGSKLHGGVKVRLLIANAGSKTDDNMGQSTKGLCINNLPVWCAPVPSNLRMLFSHSS